MNQNLARRLLFFAGLTAVLLAGCASPSDRSARSARHLPTFPNGTRVLFQGDSITDGNRGRSADPNHILGHGYAFLIAARCGEAQAGHQLEFFNRGISGNKVSDLIRRWTNDTLELNPDILSLLIGINDYNAGVAAADYEQQLDALLTDTRRALPNVKLVLCEPFGLPVGSYGADWAKHRAALAERQAIVGRLGAKHHAPVVRFQQAFDKAIRRAPAAHWIWDGVHPTYSGHQLMADEWMRTVRAAWRP